MTNLLRLRLIGINNLEKEFLPLSGVRSHYQLIRVFSLFCRHIDKSSENMVNHFRVGSSLRELVCELHEGVLDLLDLKHLVVLLLSFYFLSEQLDSLVKLTDDLRLFLELSLCLLGTRLQHLDLSLQLENLVILFKGVFRAYDLLRGWIVFQKLGKAIPHGLVLHNIGEKLLVLVEAVHLFVENLHLS